VGVNDGVSVGDGVNVALFVGTGVGVRVAVGTGVHVRVGVKLAVALGISVNVDVGVAVAGNIVMTAPVNGRPVNCTAPFELLPLMLPAFRFPWNVPLAVAVKSSTTSKFTSVNAGSTLFSVMTAVPLFPE
jgi:hypothetical protein